MAYYQYQFLPYNGGAPSIHSLRVADRTPHVLVTTSQSVSLLYYDKDRYILRTIPIPPEFKVIFATLLSGNRIAIASKDTLTDTLVLDIFASFCDALVLHDMEKTSFLLTCAPTFMMEIERMNENETFSGLLVLSTSNISAFGVVLPMGTDENPGNMTQLTQAQLESFLPELLTTSRTCLIADVYFDVEEEIAWVAYGSIDGNVSLWEYELYQMRFIRNSKCLRQFDFTDALTCIKLYQAISTLNMLVTSVSGHATVLRNVSNEGEDRVVVCRRDALGLESIYAADMLDIDLDGCEELLLGTSEKGLEAYTQDEVKGFETRIKECEMDQKALADAQETDFSISMDRLERAYMEMEDKEVETQHLASKNAAEICKKPTCNRILQVAGSVYSLAHADLDGDGVDELIVAGSTGLYIMIADATLVVRKVETVLRTFGK